MKERKKKKEEEECTYNRGCGQMIAMLKNKTLVVVVVV
jgi:hypothetical protein